MAKLKAYGKGNGANEYKVLGVLGINYGQVEQPVIGWLYRRYNPTINMQGNKVYPFHTWCLQYADDDIAEKDFDTFAEAKKFIETEV